MDLPDFRDEGFRKMKEIKISHAAMPEAMKRFVANIRDRKRDRVFSDVFAAGASAALVSQLMRKSPWYLIGSATALLVTAIALRFAQAKKVHAAHRWEEWDASVLTGLEGLVETHPIFHVDLAGNLFLRKATWKEKALLERQEKWYAKLGLNYWWWRGRFPHTIEKSAPPSSRPPRNPDDPAGKPVRPKGGSPKGLKRAEEIPKAPSAPRTPEPAPKKNVPVSVARRWRRR